MIERYTREEMKKIWEAENRFKIWLDIELYAVEAFNKLGLVPDRALREIKKRAKFDIKRIDEIEKVVKHDVIAFLTSVNEHIGENSRYLHYGMTSSDVLDTSLAVQLKQAGELIIKGIDELLLTLKEKAYQYKDTPTIGRSHGIHAEPTTFGLKMALFYECMRRNRKRMADAIEDISYGKISGAVGNFANINPFVENYVCNKLGLKPEPVSTQIIQRDRHAHYFATLAVVAGTLEQIAVEIRHLQRTEVREAEEFFSKGQKGSSAMPHKRNPILSENITGLSRLVRSYSLSALENVALWHERDISHSSVERVIGPDATILLDFMIHRTIGLIKNLIVYPENMIRNLNLTKGLIYSQRVLLMLAEAGMKRDTAYEVVQRNAMKSWEEGLDFKELIKKDKDVKKLLSEKEVESAFDIDYYLKNVDFIFKRVFEEK
ncbi:MAG: adenylosuccinate lyase [Proteobacteria bacterium]|nr:adenylosuccinate lyase [Pseudomonadota bacterium]